MVLRSDHDIDYTKFKNEKHKTPHFFQITTFPVNEIYKCPTLREAAWECGLWVTAGGGASPINFVFWVLFVYTAWPLL